MALIASLAPIVSEAGRSFVRYDEAKESHHAKVMPERIATSHRFLGAVRALQPNLSFTKAAWTKALSMMYEKNKHLNNWTMKPEDLVSWKEAMMRRCQNMCRAVSQAELKATKSLQAGRKCPPG